MAHLHKKETSVNATGDISDLSRLEYRRTPVPGDSPFHYQSDPGTHLLSIVELNLDPNPPIGMPRFDDVYGKLRGELSRAVSPFSRYRFTVFRDGVEWVATEGRICVDELLHPSQPGIEKCAYLDKGPVEMWTRMHSPAPWYARAKYTLRVEMWEPEGAVITEFEGSAWIESREDETGPLNCCVS